MPTRHLRLIHWNEAEAKERATLLEQAGYTVDYSPPTPARMRALKNSPPWAVVIDLTRLPSQGRDVAVTLRGYKILRNIPFLFVEGEPEKIARIRDLLPDSIFTTWDRILSDLQTAPDFTPAENAAPVSSFAAYVNAPLIQKLGIHTGTQAAVINMPADFEQLLGPLPEGAQLFSSPNPDCTLILWFVRSRLELEEGIETIRHLVGKDGLWIAWPKLGSGVSTDLTQTVVRKIGLECGLVDYKISMIDKTWSGLRFARRKPSRQPD
jgi:hypothetical protein